MALTEPEYLKWLLDSRQPVVVVDLRSPRDFRRGHVPGAVSVPLAELDRRFAEIPTQPMVVLYCRCPLEEAATAYSFLEAEGLREPRGAPGGLRRLAQAPLPGDRVAALAPPLTRALIRVT